MKLAKLNFEINSAKGLVHVDHDFFRNQKVHAFIHSHALFDLTAGKGREKLLREILSPNSLFPKTRGELRARLNSLRLKPEPLIPLLKEAIARLEYYSDLTKENEQNHFDHNVRRPLYFARFSAQAAARALSRIQKEKK
ncbi:hypothetical protein HY993_04100 [Candidatus Micrarchaeota archaeon]|nr:hypothetical protein [Candidatus Micrarchaeota archaeon]